jgi:hypothetical protein
MLHHSISVRKITLPLLSALLERRKQRLTSNIRNMRATCSLPKWTVFLPVLFFGTPSVRAQWTTDTQQNTLVADIATEDMKMIAGPDGSSYIACWHPVPAPQHYEMRLQRLDADGHQTFGPEGLLVDGSLPMSTFIVTWDLTSDDEGNLYIGMTATGDGSAVVHKLSPTGEPLWGTGGLPLGEGYDVKVLPLSNGEVLVSYLPGNQAALRKFSPDGTSQWAEPIVLPTLNGGIRTVTGELAELSGGRFEVIYFEPGGFAPYGPAFARCFDLSGTSQWPAPVPLTGPGQSVQTNRRYDLCQTGDTVFVGLPAALGLNIQAYIQRIDPDGTTPWGSSGVPFAVQSAYYERDIRIAMAPGADRLWAIAEYTPSGQGSTGEYIQQIHTASGAPLLGADAVEVFAPTSNRSHQGKLRLWQGRPYFLVTDGQSNGVFPVDIRLVHPDTSGQLDTLEGFLAVGTYPTGVKSRIQLREASPDGKAIAAWVENRGVSLAYAQRVPLASPPVNLPFIVGDSLLCPNGTGTVSTQLFDSYQWYRRYFGATDATPIPGATGQSLVMDYSSYAASFLSVEVTLGDSTYLSEEFLVDGLLFLPPVVQTTGTYSVGSSGELLLCPGDTIFLTLLPPYTTNITWFEDGQAIPGANETTLAITSPGTYTVEGAPELCPDYRSGLGLFLTVVPCVSDSRTAAEPSDLSLYPNPVRDQLTIRSPAAGSGRYSVWDSQGRQVLSGTWEGANRTLDVRGLAPGLYTLVWQAGTQRSLERFVVLD